MEKLYLSDNQLGQLTNDDQELFIQANGLYGGNFEQFNEQFLLLNSIAEGAYGAVSKVYEKQTEMFYAMKRMPKQINDYTKNRISILRELQIVQRMFEEDSEFKSSHFVLKCQKYYYQRQEDKFSGEVSFQLLFIYKLAQCDLFQLILSNRKMQVNFSEDKVKSFLWQTLNGLELLFNKYQIRHRDLKPQNILVMENGIFLIADFTTCKVKLFEEQTMKSNIRSQQSRNQSNLQGTIDYWPPEINKLYLNQNGSISQEINNGKIDVFSLAIVALCLLFYQVQAKDLTELQSEGKEIKKLINQIKDQKLKELLKNMSCWEIKNRWSVEESIKYFRMNFLQEIYDFEQKQSFFRNQEQSQINQVLKNEQVNIEISQMFKQNYQQENKNQYQIKLKQNNTKKSGCFSLFSSKPIQQEKNLNQKDLEKSFKNKKLINLSQTQIKQISCSLDGNFLALGNDQGLMIWDLIKKKQIEIVNKIQSGKCFIVDFTFDGQFICQIAGSEGKDLVLYQKEKINFSFQDKFQSNQQFHKLSMSKKILQFCVSTNQGIIYVFQINKIQDKSFLEKIKELKNERHEIIFDLAISNNDQLIASSNGGVQLCIWNQDSQQIIQELKIIKFIYFIKFSENDEIIFLAINKDIQIYSIGKKQILSIQEGHTNSISGIVLSLDNQYIYSTDEDGNFFQWIRSTNQNNNSCSLINKFKFDKFQINSISFNHKNQVYFASAEGKIYLVLI